MKNRADIINPRATEERIELLFTGNVELSVISGLLDQQFRRNSYGSIDPRGLII